MSITCLNPNITISQFIDKFLQHYTMFTDISEEYAVFESWEFCPMSKYHYDCFVEIANFYKMPITNIRQKYIWDGKQLDVTQLPTFHCLMHEVGHFVNCPKKYRNKVDYGLGSGGNYKAEQLRDDHEEDILASIFGIYFEYLVGDDVSITIGDTGYDVQMTRQNLENAFQHFIDLGLLDKNGKPTCSIN